MLHLPSCIYTKCLKVREGRAQAFRIGVDQALALAQDSEFKAFFAIGYSHDY